jgi:polar amino acid transport system permease protein
MSVLEADRSFDDIHDEPIVVPIRHWGRQVSAVVVIAVLIGFAIVVGRSQEVTWSAIPDFLFNAAILSGIAVTLQLTFWAMIFGIVLGVVAANMKMSANPVLMLVATGYTWFFRGTPLLVQIFFWFNIALFIPFIAVGPYSVSTNVLVTPWVAGLLALSLHEGANMAEVVRGGMLSVDPGQNDACQALGMTRAQALRRIILPQAVRVILPPTGNQAIGMLKASATVSVIGTHDLLTEAENTYARNFLVIELLFVAAIWYLVMTTIASVGQYYLERYFDKSKADSGPSMLKRTWLNLGFGSLLRACR